MTDPSAAQHRVAIQEKILKEYERRKRETPTSLYAPWNRGQTFLQDSRRRLAAEMLHAAGAFPTSTSRCLEVGHGHIGWLADLIAWGVPATNLHGIELIPERAETTRDLIPCADIRIGDATRMPWLSGSFDLIVVSTVFTSILSDRVRKDLADEITRVMATNGTLMWYDFAVNNPRNRQVRRVTRAELRALFPSLRGSICSVSLAPPIARFVAPRCIWLASLLETVPFLRTHLIAVLRKL